MLDRPWVGPANLSVNRWNENQNPGSTIGRVDGSNIEYQYPKTVLSAGERGQRAGSLAL
jgi:hypothetical protein